jgi:hypothetical protein
MVLGIYTIKDIETQYDSKLRFESEIENLISQIQMLKEQREKMLQILNAQPFIGPMLLKLSQMGYTEDDILNLELAYHKLVNGTYSIEDLTKGIVKIIDMIMTATFNQQEVVNDYKLETLSKLPRICPV